MNCEDLMNIPKIYSGMKLIAGGSGMYRNIRWIYFADCTQCLSDDFKVSQLIHGGELVIVTNAALTDHDDKMLCTSLIFHRSYARHWWKKKATQTR